MREQELALGNRLSRLISFVVGQCAGELLAAGQREIDIFRLGHLSGRCPNRKK